MDRAVYPSDIPREHFEGVRAMLEAARRKTRPRKHDLYDVFCAAIYFIDSGTAWRSLPPSYPPWRTVHEYFTQWTAGPAGERTLLELALEKAGRPATAVHLRDMLSRPSRRAS